MKYFLALTVLLLLTATPQLHAQKVDNLLELKASSTNPLLSRLGKAYAAPSIEMKDYWTWGSSVIKDNEGKYHIYASRFPKSLPFHPGWMVASEIVHGVSDVPQGPYTFTDVALPIRGAQYWDGRSTHNPRILTYKGKYYLIYMGSTHPFEEPTMKGLTLDSKWCIVGRSNKRVGLAIADSPYGPWKRLDKPIFEPKPNTFYSFFTSNPSPIIQEDGSVMMIFKGRSYKGNTHSDMALGMAYAPSIEGPYQVLNNDQPIFHVEKQGEAEDPFLWKDSEGYHAIFKDHVAKFTGERGGGVMAHSKDGIDWVMDKDPKAYSRTIERADGTTHMQGQLERPFIFFENGEPTHLFFATMDGRGGFDNATRSWNMVIPILPKKESERAEVQFALNTYRRYANEAKAVKDPAKEQSIEAFRQYYAKNIYREKSLSTPLSWEECIAQLNENGQFTDMIELENKHRASNLVQLSYSGPERDLGIFMSEAHNRIWKIAEAYRAGKITEEEALTPKYLQSIIHYGMMEMSRSNSGPRFHASCFSIPTSTVNTYFCFLKQMDEVEAGKSENPQLIQACDILKALSLQSWTQPLRNDETDLNITHIDRFRNHVWWVGGNALAYRSLLPCAFMYRSIPMVDVLAEVGQKCISAVSQNTYNKAFWREGFTADGAGWGHGMQCLVWGYPIDGTSSALTLLGSLKGSPWEQRLNRKNVDVLMNFFRGSNWYYYKGYVLPCLDRYSAVYMSKPEPVKYVTMINKLLKEWPDSFTSAEIAELKQLQQEIAIKQIDMSEFAAGEYSGTRWFFNNDDLIKKNPDYHVTINMASIRCDGLESAIDFADEYNFCTADGQTLFQKRGTEYRRIIGAWDVMALPGITARKGMDQLVPVSNWRGYCSKHNFAGGATRGETNAVAGFFFEKMNASDKDDVNDRGSSEQKNSLLYGVKAHKSYFLLGNYLVALGAGITNLTPNVTGAIHTTIDQTFKADVVQICKENETSELTRQGIPLSFVENGKSIWVSQKGGFSYTVLPELTANAYFIHEHKANEWNKRNQSNVGKIDLPETTEILRLWVDHGNAPVDATYGYVVYCGEGVPTGKKLPFHILRNDTLVQAVQSNDRTVVEAVFYQKNQTLKAKGFTITTHSPAVLLLEKVGKEYLLTVNDPEMNANLQQMTVIINKIPFQLPLPQGELSGKPTTLKLGKL